MSFIIGRGNGGGATESKFHTPTVFTTAGTSSFVSSPAAAIHQPWSPDLPLKGANASYIYNTYLINGINAYDVVIRYGEQKSVSGFIYASNAQFNTMGIQACEIWAIPNEVDVPTNWGAQADTTNMTKIWDSDAGADPTFPLAVDSDAWEFLTKPALDYSFSGGSVDVWGLILRPKTNHGHASRTVIDRFLVY